jgi:hypothetical protein
MELVPALPGLRRLAAGNGKGRGKGNAINASLPQPQEETTYEIQLQTYDCYISKARELS